MSEERARYLLQQYAANKATKDEVAEMFALLQQAENEAVLKRLVLEARNDGEHEMPVTEEEWGLMWHAIQSATFANRQ